jgi:glycosyltransferase involved in cell wall biosynthesis
VAPARNLNLVPLRVIEVFEGEVDRTAAAVVAELVRLGVEVCAVCPPRSVALFEGTGAVMTPLQVGTGVASLSALRRLLRQGAPAGDGPEPVDGPDLVHAHGLRAGLAAALARPGSLPLVLTWSDPVATAGVPALVTRAITRTVVPAASAVLAATPELVTAATQLGAGEVLAVPPTMPEPPALTRSAEQVREELALSAEGPIVLSRAKLVEETRLDVLVAASARWRRDGAAAHVVLVGIGPAYRDLVAQATVARAPVTFAGDRTTAAFEAEEERAGVEDLLAAATLAVVTDLRARPEFAARAARAGVALVVPAGGVITRLLGEDAVVAVAPGDVEALDETVRSLLHDPGARAAVAERARALVSTWPDAAGAAERLMELYARVSRATAAGPADGAERSTAPASDTPGGLR